jgi:hypothetical protein
MKVAPHQAVIIIKTEIMEKLHTGEVSGIPIKDKDIPNQYITIYGDTYEECKKNVLAFIGKINETTKD